LRRFCRYILKLRKAAKRAKTEEERRKVEEGFKEVSLKIKEAIERGIGRSGAEDIVTLLERLTRLVEYIGRGYRTGEVETMLNDSLKGYGQVLLERGVRKGVRRGRLEGKLETAMNALKMGIPIQQTAQITGIPEAELLKQLNKPPALGTGNK
jgi:hypothetical protein